MPVSRMKSTQLFNEFHTANDYSNQDELHVCIIMSKSGNNNGSEA